ncbi:MAG: 1,2-phenylacetyl-CoA epoxidase subunit PaaC [Vulcanimicrobiaceae bacterium]
MDGDATLAEYGLRIGDNALVLGQRLAEWTGHGPVLEEDLALTNVALDLIGQARLWLSYAGEVEGRGRDEDRLAYFRGQGEFRNVLLVERPNGNYADTTARQFLFDTWHFHLLSALSASSDGRIAAIARKAVREVAYHVRRSGDWVVRLGDGTELSHRRMQAAIDDLWPFTGELFAPDAVDVELARRGAGCDLGALREPWLGHVTSVLADATLTVPTDGWMHAGGKAGRHSEQLGYLLAEMQAVPRSVPGERW